MKTHGVDLCMHTPMWTCIHMHMCTHKHNNQHVTGAPHVEPLMNVAYELWRERNCVCGPHKSDVGTPGDF